MIAVKHPPGPRGHWLLGNVREFRGEKLDFYTHLAREHGDVAAFRLGPKRLVLLSHPNYIEQVLVTDNRNFIKHFVLQLLRPVMGNGLLTSEGDFWRRQRRLIQPAFLRQRVDSYGSIFVEHADRFAQACEHGDTRDLHADMTRLTLGIVGQALLDAEVRETHKVGELLDFLMDDFSYRLESAFPAPKWLPTPWNLRVNRAHARLKSIIDDIIRQRRREKGRRGDVLATLLEARDQDDGATLSDAQIRDEVMTLFLAGHDTTANALTWTWYLLAQHPEVEARLHDELERVLAGRLPSVADVPRLVYAERVILESMRLYPPVYAFGREALADCTIGGFPIPRGSTVLMSQWVVHRDPRWYLEPERFHPERWADLKGYGLFTAPAGDGTDSTPVMPRYAYFPFGGGPRVCIGNTFALLEAVLVLATIAPRWRFQLVPDHVVQPWPSVTLRPRYGLKVTLDRRAERANRGGTEATEKTKG